MIEFATNPEYPFRAFDDNIRAARKNEPATPFKSPCNYFAEALPVQDMFVDGSTGQKPFQILLHFRDSAQKVSKLKSENKIRPNPLFLP